MNPSKPDLLFSNKVVIVTGASRGIGSATAQAFARQGATVIINYRSDAAGAEKTLARVQDEGGKAHILQADISLIEDIDRMVTQTEQEIGPIEVLINNAAAINRQSFLDVTMEGFDMTFSTNIRGVFYLSQQVARGMVKRQHGSIIHTSSILAQLSVPTRTVYSASKGAVESLTRAMALDLAPFNIRVNAISPGMIRTEALEAGFSSPEVLESLANYIPGKRIGDPDEIAQVALFLASDKASYINGIVIPVDGGMSAREAGPPSNK
jgi:NAD(P)-dependent dehydrogenase (short-subunit alcohol dehydrogenase family)